MAGVVSMGRYPFNEEKDTGAGLDTGWIGRLELLHHQVCTRTCTLGAGTVVQFSCSAHIA